MLYVPFRTLHEALDWGQFRNVVLPQLHGDEDPQRWPMCFQARLAYTPEIFPEFIRQLVR